MLLCGYFNSYLFFFLSDFLVAHLYSYFALFLFVNVQSFFYVTSLFANKSLIWNTREINLMFSEKNSAFLKMLKIHLLHIIGGMLKSYLCISVKMLSDECNITKCIVHRIVAEDFASWSGQHALAHRVHSHGFLGETP